MNLNKKKLWTFRILFGLSILVGTWFNYIMLVWGLSGIAMLISLITCLYLEGKNDAILRRRLS